MTKRVKEGEITQLEFEAGLTRFSTLPTSTMPMNVAAVTKLYLVSSRTRCVVARTHSAHRIYGIANLMRRSCYTPQSKMRDLLGSQAPIIPPSSSPRCDFEVRKRLEGCEQPRHLLGTGRDCEVEYTVPL
jgi:hypothetical protein